MAYALRALQGRVVPLVEFRIDEAVRWRAPGPRVRGSPAAYYNDETRRKVHRGRLAPHRRRRGDQDGAFIKLVDRTKDLIKSGGEWIRSVELENAIMAHPEVLEAAVIAMPHERWVERPCACVVRRDGQRPHGDEVIEFLGDKVAKWWLPDGVEFIDEVPKTSVGKFDKKVLRAQLAEGWHSSGRRSACPRGGRCHPAVALRCEYGTSHRLRLAIDACCRLCRPTAPTSGTSSMS